jgi:peptidoglycan/xylan/chitin deacetylase (PgdA/CDA1 family)
MLKDNQQLFDIFVAKQEYSGKRDKHGRFIYHFSNYKDVLIPIVSEYLMSKGFHVEWGDGYKFAACLTHDVDTVYPSWRYTIFSSLKMFSSLQIKNGLNRVIAKVNMDKRKNPFWNFNKIMEIEKKFNAKSTFFFKATNKDPANWIYNIESLKDELEHISDNGFEIGLHGGYYSYNNPQALQEEKIRLEKVLGKPIVGIRMHYLRFEVPYTWRMLKDIGFKYDTTFGYPDMPGFRNGMCYPFKPYDLFHEEVIDILEIPLNVMDNTLFHIGLEKGWNIMKKIIDYTQKYSGVVTILWHNTTFDEVFWGNWSKIYNKLLHYLAEKKAWITTAEDIYKYWSKNF